MHALIVLGAAAIPPASTVLRPRFGHLPLVLIALCLLWILLLRLGLPRFGRRATIAALLAAGFLVLSWGPRIAARTWGTGWLTPAYYRYVVLPSTVVQVTILLCLVSAPLWVPAGLWARRRARPGAAAAPAPDSTPAPEGPTRRDVLSALAWAGPGTAFLVASWGVAVGAQRIVVRRLRLAVPGLPPALRGLRIGHLTDVHVAHDLTQLSQLEAGLELLARERLDLVAATGDLCDSPRLLPDVVSLIGQVPARLGHFACLGNHELYLGLSHVRRTFDRSQVQLLEDRAVRLGPALTVAGTSYPHGRTPRIDHRRVPRLLDAALSERAGDTRTLLLSHHPHVFHHIAGRKVDLMLAGHTHGGQLGLGDGSPLEGLYGYLRGAFSGPAGDPAQLFVSSGLGHWLPFRINCPPEVVVIELA